MALVQRGRTRALDVVSEMDRLSPLHMGRDVLLLEFALVQREMVHLAFFAIKSLLLPGILARRVSLVATGVPLVAS